MIRLSFIILFLLISLLSLFRAPAYIFWLLAIIVTEYPIIFAVITTILIVSGIWVHKYQLTGTLIGVLALVIFLSPIARAYFVAKELRSGITAAFNIKDDNAAAFNLLKLFKSKKVVAFKSLTYVKYADTSLTLDFYQSRVSGKKPCVIVVHGGSWAGGDSRQLPELNSHLAASGYNVASVNYRMAPKWQTPAPVEDVKNCLIYLKKHAEDYHIDTNQFILLGRSAGAQIALLAAYTLPEADIKGVIDFYGPADMVWGYSVPSNPLVMDSRKVMRDYIGGSYQQVPAKYAACSPIDFISRHTVPTLIIHGDNDVLVAPEHSRRLNLKLQQNGIRHYWLRLPWATHGFDFNLNGPGGQLSTYAVDRFLKAVTH